MTRKPLIAGNWKMHRTLAQSPRCARSAAYRRAAAGTSTRVARRSRLWPQRRALAATASPWARRTMHGRRAAPTPAKSRRYAGGSGGALRHHRPLRAARDDSASRTPPHGKVRAALATASRRSSPSARPRRARRGLAQRAVGAQVALAVRWRTPPPRSRAASSPTSRSGPSAPATPTRRPRPNRIMGAIRAAVAGLEDCRMLYGGSMKPDNAAAFVAQPNIDGGLVGGASLIPHRWPRERRESRRGGRVKRRPPFVLAILDGWGQRRRNGNAIAGRRLRSGSASSRPILTPSRRQRR